MHWKTKAAILRWLCHAPFADQLLYQLQRHATREWPRPAVALDNLLKAAQRVAAVRNTGRFLEIGAGGDLAVAVALRMIGVQHITCVDVTRLARLPMIQHAAEHMARRLGTAIPTLQTWPDLEAFGITYVAPAKLQATAMPALSFDAFYSVDTLEHIPPAELANVLKTARGLLKADGACVHIVDYSDHYARGTDLSRFNFLTYDDAGWRPFNTRLHYVNRLRHSEMLAMFSAAGLPVQRAEPDAAEPQPQILDQLGVWAADDSCWVDGSH